MFSSNEEKAKYFQGILFKRSIGVSFSDLFLEWAKVAPIQHEGNNNLLLAEEVRQKVV